MCGVSFFLVRSWGGTSIISRLKTLQAGREVRPA
jgi:hypothetical protein